MWKNNTQLLSWLLCQVLLVNYSNCCTSAPEQNSEPKGLSWLTQRLQKEFQPPMLAPSMIMPVSRSQDESFLACWDRWSGPGHWHIDQGEGWKSKDEEWSSNVHLKPRDIPDSKAKITNFWLHNYPWQLWKKRPLRPQEIKIPGDESSCNNRASYLHNWNQLAVGCLAIRWGIASPPNKRLVNRQPDGEHGPEVSSGCFVLEEKQRCFFLKF